MASSTTIATAIIGLISHSGPVNSAEIPAVSLSDSSQLLSQSLAWDSTLRVARLVDSQQQTTSLVLQLEILDKPATTYANAVYQVLAKTEDSDWQVIYTNRGARLLPTASGPSIMPPEEIPITVLQERLKTEFGKGVSLDDVEIHCTVQIRYDLPGGRRDLRETFEVSQFYTAIGQTTTTELTRVLALGSTTNTTTTSTTTPPTGSTTTPGTTVTGGAIPTPDATGQSLPASGNQITLANGYRITLVDVRFSSTSSTWKYLVEELPQAQDLSNWVLGLPSCATVISATPRGEQVNPDPNARISGIKWQPGGGFVTGEFSVTLAGSLKVGTIQVAAKGPDVVLGTVNGPVCQ